MAEACCLGNRWKCCISTWFMRRGRGGEMLEKPKQTLCFWQQDYLHIFQISLLLLEIQNTVTLCTFQPFNVLQNRYSRSSLKQGTSHEIGLPSVIQRVLWKCLWMCFSGSYLITHQLNPEVHECGTRGTIQCPLLLLRYGMIAAFEKKNWIHPEQP